MNAGVDLTNPQSWNAYAYVLGNPLNGVDPTGMSLCTPTGESIACVQNDGPGTPEENYQMLGYGQGGPLYYTFGIPTANPSSSNAPATNSPSTSTPPKSVFSTPGNCVAGFAGVGASVGGTVGAWVGGGIGVAGGAAGGTLFAPVVGTIGGGALGAEIGTAGGALVGTGLGASAGYLVGSIVCNSGISGGGGGGPQDGKLSPGEIRTLETETGESAHQIKAETLGANKNIAQYDLYKDLREEVFLKAKGGIGEAIPTGLRIR